MTRPHRRPTPAPASRGCESQNRTNSLWRSSGAAWPAGDTAAAPPRGKNARAAVAATTNMSISTSAAGLARAALRILEEAAGNRDHGVRRPCSRDMNKRGHGDVRDHTHQANRLEEHERRVCHVEQEPEAGGGEQEDVARGVLRRLGQPRARRRESAARTYHRRAEQRDRDSCQVRISALVDLGALTVALTSQKLRQPGCVASGVNVEDTNAEASPPRASNVSKRRTFLVMSTLADSAIVSASGGTSSGDCGPRDA